MDEDMWHHPTTKENLKRLESFGNKIIPVEKGDLASGLYGEGRMAEPEQIIKYITASFFLTRPLAGKKAIVTAGPTYEPIDPVRFIGNHSSGKMGIAIAKELYNRGADVTLIMGPSQIEFSSDDISVIRVTTANEMYNATSDVFGKTDIAIMAAAVADYSPVLTANEKIKKKEERFTIEMTKTKDILKSLGEKKKPGQVLVGFALETNNETQNAIDKMKDKNADMIVLNSLNDIGAGFRNDTNKITIFEKGGREFKYEIKPKTQVAKDIVDTIIRLYYA
jgi:phosphopantothenoylcysteine decarboxylase/phosphopantothenate--cysteine ligase